LASFEESALVKRKVRTSERVVLPLSFGAWMSVKPAGAGLITFLVVIPRTFSAQI
jgi:hypothetical protein